MEIPVHDNFLVAYEVFCERREIRLRTEYRDGGEPFEFIDVTFCHVEAYHFWQDCLDNIIFDIDEVAPDYIYREYRNEFEAGRHYGWPASWGKTELATLEHFKHSAVRGWRIMSSAGLEGWVLAQSVEWTSRKGQAP